MRTLRQSNARYEALCREADAAARVIPAGHRAALDHVAQLLGATLHQLTARTRARAADERRQAAMWLLQQRGLSQSAIGRLLDRDPSTVLSGLRTVAARRAADRDYAAQLDRLLARLARLSRGLPLDDD
jgi:chromosomal replication initiation ATPase DnaA